MKWSDAQATELKELCFAETSNADLAAHFGVPVAEIHAKRSQLGITIPKVKAMQGKPTQIGINQEFEAAVVEMEKSTEKGLETFFNAGDTCIVLARSGDTALIVRPTNGCCPYVVPLQHKPGAKDWWQGRYFSNLANAWAFYSKEVGGNVVDT